MGYGDIERRHAEPFALALIQDPDFRAWVIRHTEFANFADEARILHEEMKQLRGTSQTWWRSHYTEKCRCAGCSGKETDLLAIFETTTAFRFAIHIEVKHPRDRFKNDGIQSRGYPLRAQCWVLNPPASVLPHHMATTLLLFSETKAEEYAQHLCHFEAHITFESIKKCFPHATV